MNVRRICLRPAAAWRRTKCALRGYLDARTPHERLWIVALMILMIAALEVVQLAASYRRLERTKNHTQMIHDTEQEQE